MAQPRGWGAGRGQSERPPTSFGSSAAPGRASVFALARWTLQAAGSGDGRRAPTTSTTSTTSSPSCVHCTSTTNLEPVRDSSLSGKLHDHAPLHLPRRHRPRPSSLPAGQTPTTRARRSSARFSAEPVHRPSTTGLGA
ncbi:hypothetical protein E4U42_004879 [Claviceps africana]|uniref:Uncharacterized protein n=1 Tax=Claviceps africana TaxID=83212 RepID=A0A8K0JCI0_9HYPO|nr:hypothetical protein E4U42_004879 [Claviceps africana]